MKRLYSLIKFFILSMLTVAILTAVALTTAYLIIVPGLPSIDKLKDVHLQVPLKIFTKDGLLIQEYGKKRRTPLEFANIPPLMIKAFISAEDDRFFEHPGVDYRGLIRAAITVMTRTRKLGGSTITMQVARNFFLTHKRTYSRKLKEIFLSLKIESELSKQEIMELYLNKIFLGHRSYGVGAAAEVYYGKKLHLLNLAQIAMIAGLPKAPSAYNPLANPKRAKSRRHYVLGRMLKLDHITAAMFEQADIAPITAKLHAAKPEIEANYVAEMIRAEMFERFGNKADTQGYQVFTTIVPKLQVAANNAVRKALLDYDQRHGFRGPEKHTNITGKRALNGIPAIPGLIPGLVTALGEQSAEILTANTTIHLDWEAMQWARPYKNENRRGPKPKTAADILRLGDIIRLQETDGQWRLTQIPRANGALVALDPNNGAVQALVGGFDYFHSKFNRVTQALRQPGSGFKPFVYAAALTKDYTAASVINDVPIIFHDSALEGAWRPENYDNKFHGPTRLRTGLAKSINLISIHLLREITTRYAIQYASRFGFDSQRLPNNLSLALGSCSVTPLELATAYAVFANGGFKVTPFFIDKIKNDRGTIIYQHKPLEVCNDCDTVTTSTTVADSSQDNPPTTATATATTIATNQTKRQLIAPRVISPQIHFIMNSMLRDVIRYGTGKRAKVLNRNDLAGKTGTTNDQRDAWFSGFHPNLVAISWLGFDSTAPLGHKETGGKAALPMWISFMKQALQDLPEVQMKQPPGLVTIKIDPTTGQPVPADSPKAIFEVFRSKNAPERATQKNGNQPLLEKTDELEEPIY